MRHTIVLGIASVAVCMAALSACTGKAPDPQPPAPPPASTTLDPIAPLYGVWEFTDFCGDHGGSCTPHDPDKHPHFSNRSDVPNGGSVGDLILIRKTGEKYAARILYQNDNDDQKTQGTMLPAKVCHTIPKAGTMDVIGLACRFDDILHYGGAHGSPPGPQAKANHWLVICPDKHPTTGNRRIHVDVMLAKTASDTLEKAKCPLNPAGAPADGISPTAVLHYGDGHGDPP